MSNTDLSISRIAYKNLGHKPTRTVGLVLLTTLLSFLLFGGTILSLSLQKGMESVKARLGADLMVVPLENDSDMEAVLLKGQPSCFYFRKTVADKVAAIDGIEAVTTQFFLTSLSAECCDVPVQLIGFDPETDFSVQPWIAKVYKGSLSEGAVIIGSDINAQNGSTIKFFDRQYKIAARLEKTGTGLDQAVYATMDTIRELYRDALAKGQTFLEEANPDTSVSSVLVRVEDGYDRSVVIKQIRKSLGGVTVIESQNIISGIAQHLETFASFSALFIILFFLIAMLTLYLVFTISVNERKKEFAILRILGATKDRVIRILLYEAFYISLMGGTAGIVTASLVVFPFNTYIGDSLGLPFIRLSIGAVLMILLMTLFVIALTGPLASVQAAWKAGNAESYLVMREGE